MISEYYQGKDFKVERPSKLSRICCIIHNCDTMNFPLPVTYGHGNREGDKSPTSTESGNVLISQAKASHGAAVQHSLSDLTLKKEVDCISKLQENSVWDPDRR